MFQLSQIIKTLDDYKAIKGQVQMLDRQVRDLDQWRHLQSHQQGKELVLKSELNLLIEMMKREIEVAMRTHFDIFKNETDGNMTKKVEMAELKPLLQAKVSTSEFWKEIEHVKTLIHSISREMAVAGIGGVAVGASSANKSSSGGVGSAALRTLLKQECENMVT